MLGFIIRRVVMSVFVVLCVIAITFLLVRQMPGSPFAAERSIDPLILEAMEARYDLDKPWYGQLSAYLHGLSPIGFREMENGERTFGFKPMDFQISSVYRNRSVAEILSQTLPTSFLLGAVSFVIATTGGIWLGTLAASRKNTLIDNSAMLAALFAISIPTFVTGPLLILIFGIWLGVFPLLGWESPAHMVLPSICLALPYMAYIARLQRNSMLETVTADYIRTARAKGLDEKRVIYKHALKVAILPVVSFCGPLAAHLLTGSIVVEKIFSIPGAGRFFIEAVINRDSFLLAGVVIVYCSLLVFFNLLVDLIYFALDRRISLDG